MNKSLFRRILPLALLLVFMVFLMPRDAKFPYEWRVGKEWKYETLYAQFDFPILKTEEQLREDKANASLEFIPYFEYSEEDTYKILSAIEDLELGKYKKKVLNEIEKIYEIGVLADETKGNRNEQWESELIYIIRDKEARQHPKEEVFRQNTAKKELFTELSEKIQIEVDIDSLLKNSGVYNYLLPNLFYDEHTTNLAQEELQDRISPTIGYANAGQLIVSENEMVTSDISQILDSYREEFESNIGYLRSPLMLLLGNFLILLSLISLFFITIKICSPKAFNSNRIFVVIDLYVLFAFLTILLGRMGGEYVLLAPYTLMIFFYRSFFSDRESLLYYVVSLLPLLICSANGVVLYIMFLISGLLSLVLFNSYAKAWQQFLRALFTFLALVILLFAFRANDFVTGNVWRQIALLLLNSLLTMVALPLLSLFEKIYNLVSDFRLVELGDTSSEVMRIMEQKAPGSFQHSIQVMNMAETVARAVNVNPELVRVGALYHDIGKIKNPLCFIENESLISLDEQNDHKYHSTIDSMQSAKDIINHINDGVEIASEHHLPKLVKDFIITHHGTTCVRYFYDKFVKDGGDPSLINEFCYKGEKPKTKAQIILMICDSIEAASRTVKVKTIENYSLLVENIVTTKMEEGQFDEVNITFADLYIIKETIKNYLSQLNHNRVVYPKKKEIK